MAKSVQKTQVQKFRETARAADADEAKEEFVVKLKALAKPRAQPKAAKLKKRS